MSCLLFGAEDDGWLFQGEWGLLAFGGVTSDGRPFSSLGPFLLFQTKSSKPTDTVDCSVAAVEPPLILIAQFRHLRSV